ncbi:hypothetical protein ASD78_11950 [Lysobacter sp. Root667]|uniref:CAF17-like 4Fe-4S cluster assembly/insertion protein YgfZ n=1 Tax=Lysobacter sp. Root667 TaxID=1736581 RepID=UPI0006F89929|nr:folate-binding protein YgfZ [Lysobacter sp. Root667]KRA74206.1 hypothetical protein ASD78_11950 [Lysobacter sp. Root667]
MHDNPQAPSGQAFALPGHRVIELSGRDAAVFAQAQFMNDVNALAPGQWHWSGWLTPKGRVIALMALLRLADERIWLLLPDADPETIAAALKRYLFRSKTVVAVRSDLAVEARYAAPGQARGNALGGDEGSGIELDLSGDGGARSLRIVATHGVPEDAAALERWALDDLRHGLPRLGPEQVEQWTPQQLSLERLGAFSVKKGCYPGQEIVARTHFLGKAKRGLMRLRGAGVAAQDEVTTGAAAAGAAGAVSPVGQVICAVNDEGLAVMPLQAPDVPLFTGGQPCEPLALLDGLAR